jgi:hypothetical protein
MGEVILGPTVGTCSLCYGRVAVPWEIILKGKTGIPTCENCGAKKKDVYGPIIEMERCEE